MWLDRAGWNCAAALLAGVTTAALIFIAGVGAADRTGTSAADAALGPGGIGALTAVAPAGFVGSAACADCHAAETRAWLSSQHAHAMSRAGTDTVLGDFNDVRIEHKGSTARFFRDGPRFMVETEGRDGKVAAFEVSDTFGLYPLQQYLVTFPEGRRQPLPFAYDTRPAAQGGQRWFHLYPDQAITSSDPLHWTGEQQNWNFMCAECHSTAVRKNYDAATDRFDTRFSEISVGCEACHGAAGSHVAWATSGGRDPSVANKGFASVAAARPTPDWTPDPATGSPAHGVARLPGDEVETCSRCHARRAILSEDWRPGRPLADTHLPSLLTEGLFEADGVMKDEVFNHQSFMQSLMYARGVVCSDCHDPHAGTLRAPGSAVCGQCHVPERFARVEHTGHAPGPGAPDCISCHMPKRTYMVVDDRHDHSFRIPRPDQSERLGTRNACNDCHTDKTAGWAAEAVTRWHGPQRTGFQTWGEAFHLARRGEPEAREALIRLAQTPTVPAIARATAISELRGFPSIATEDAVRKALTDPDPMVRIAAVQAQAGLPLDMRWRRLSGLLTDPVAGVRIEAAGELADQPPAQLSDADRAALTAAFREYEAAQQLNADRPEGRSNLGSFLLRQGDTAGAEKEFLAGLKQHPGSATLSVNLADLYRVLGRERDAEAALRASITVAPDAAAPRHALGLALIRQKRYPEALAALEKAYRLAPDDARYAFVYAVALQSLGQAGQSARVVADALQHNPNDADLLGLALNAALRANAIEPAREYARKLAQLRPDDPDIARLNARLN